MSVACKKEKGWSELEVYPCQSWTKDYENCEYFKANTDGECVFRHDCRCCYVLAIREADAISRLEEI